MQRRAAICAQLRMNLIRAQPCSSRHTFCVDAMHCPAGKILHSRLQNFSEHVRLDKCPPWKSWANSAVPRLLCQEENHY
jgi:hypothetical protein